MIINLKTKLKRLELNLSKKLHEELISEFVGEIKSIQLENQNQLIQKKKV